MADPAHHDLGIESMLRRRGTELVPLAPEHLPRLRSLELAQDITFRWRHAGTHPSPDDYVASTWAEQLCTFLVFASNDTSLPRGLVTAYHADHPNGHCRVAATRLGDPRTGHTTLIRGIFMLFDYLFVGWPFRKLYLEVPAFNLEQFSSATDRLFDHEGALTDYVYLAGRYWDLHHLALTRERWTDQRARLAAFIGHDPKPR